uniref:Outer membrane protein G1b n=1 Tax=Psychrobacter sp. (strain PRwf-1) TaxID=349106 RepID=A5WDX5_PSYWF
MKLFKLTAITAAVLGSSVAMAANTVVVDNTQAGNDVVVVTDAQPVGYQYDQNAGVIANTTGALVGTGKTLFNTAVHPAAVSAEIGTLGYGANIAWGLNETTELTAGWNGYNDDGTKDLDASDSWINWGKVLGDGWGNFEGDMRYDIDASNPYIGVNLRPWATNFTVGTGILVPDNKIKASLTPTGDSARVKIDGESFTINNGETVDVEIENKNKLAPYLTVGYRPNINQNWGLFGELGAAYMGKMKADVKSSAGDVALEEAAKKEIEDDNIWYPIVKAGVTYRF